MMIPFLQSNCFCDKLSTSFIIDLLEVAVEKRGTLETFCRVVVLVGYGVS